MLTPRTDNSSFKRSNTPGPERLKKHALDDVRLRMPLKANDTKRFAAVPRIAKAFNNGFRDRCGLWAVYGMLSFPLTIGVSNEPRFDRSQSGRTVLTKGNQWCA